MLSAVGLGRSLQTPDHAFPHPPHFYLFVPLQAQPGTVSPSQRHAVFSLRKFFPFPFCVRLDIQSVLPSCLCCQPCICSALGGPSYCTNTADAMRGSRAEQNKNFLRDEIKKYKMVQQVHLKEPNILQQYREVIL